MQKENIWIAGDKKTIKKYAGKLIAILNDKIIANGDAVKSVMEDVKKMKIKELPLVTKVPRKDEGMYIS